MPRLPAALAVLTLLLCALPLRGQAPEPPAEPQVSPYQRQQAWFSRDKLYHFGISAAGSGAVYAGGRAAGLSRGESALAATLVVGAVGVWKEVGTRDPDRPLTRDHLSRRDLVWDALGIAVGIALTDRLFRRDRAREEDEPVPVPAPPEP